MMKVWLSQPFLFHYHFIKDTFSYLSIPVKENVEEIKELSKGMMSIFIIDTSLYHQLCII